MAESHDNQDDTCHDRRNCQSFHAALRHDTCHDRCKCRRWTCNLYLAAP